MIKRLLLGYLTALLAGAYCSFLLFVIWSFLALFIPYLQRPEYFNALWIFSSIAILLWIAGNPNIYETLDDARTKNPAPLQNLSKRQS